MTGSAVHGAAFEEVLDQTISTDGTCIGYWRSGSGPPLVLVHGGSAEHSRWRGLLPYLVPAQRWRPFFGEVARMPEEELELVMSLPSWSARAAAAHTIVRELRLPDGYEFDPAPFADLTVAHCSWPAVTARRSCKPSPRSYHCPAGWTDAGGIGRRAVGRRP